MLCFIHHLEKDTLGNIKVINHENIKNTKLANMQKNMPPKWNAKPEIKVPDKRPPAFAI